MNPTCQNHSIKEVKKNEYLKVNGMNEGQLGGKEWMDGSNGGREGEKVRRMEGCDEMAQDVMEWID